MATLINTLALTVSLLILTVSHTNATTLFPYDQNMAKNAPIYTIHDNNYTILHDKNIAVQGRVLAVNESKYDYGTDEFTVIIATSNIFNIDAGDISNNFTEILIPPDLFSDFRQSPGKEILLRGNVSSANLSSDNYKGKKLASIGFEHCTVWLEQ